MGCMEVAVAIFSEENGTDPQLKLKSGILAGKDLRSMDSDYSFPLNNRTTVLSIDPVT